MPALARDDVTVFTGPPGEWPSADFIVSYGYRHIIREPQLSLYAGRLVNVHISLLPWNRGSDPNLWSWFDDTPKGVTIHVIDAEIDTGAIIAQRRLDLGNDETLSSSYFKLRSAAERLFCTIWPIHVVRSNERIDGGSLHSSRDKSGWFSLLSRGYDTPVAEVVALGRKMRAPT
jgi:Formyl transferase